MHILILDDDVKLTATLRDVLMLGGHEVSTVTRVAEAMGMLANVGSFHVAVFDLNLQNENAIGPLQKVKRDATANRVPIMTGGGKVGADVGMPSSWGGCQPSPTASQRANSCDAAGT